MRRTRYGCSALGIRRGKSRRDGAAASRIFDAGVAAFSGGLSHKACYSYSRTLSSFGERDAKALAPARAPLAGPLKSGKWSHPLPLGPISMHARARARRRRVERARRP